MNILIIDDEEELATILSEYLRQQGFNVVVRHDGANAVEMILGQTWALVLLDLMLPGKD